MKFLIILFVFLFWTLLTSFAQDTAAPPPALSKFVKNSQVVERNGRVVEEKTGKPLDGTLVYGGEPGEGRTTAEYKNGVRYGTFRSFNLAGIEEYRAEWLAGKQSGPEILFFPSGKNHVRRNYEDGELNGESIEWYESGEIRITGAFVKSRKHGIWRCFSRSGEVLEMVRFKNGALQSNIIDSDDIEREYKSDEGLRKRMNPNSPKK